MNSLAEYVTSVIKVEDEEVVIKKLSGQDQIELNKIKDDIERGFETILKSVIKWTFKNIDNNPLPVTKENILRLRIDILNFLGIEVLKYNAINLKKES